jgi:ABC-2 type transport system ATP-binding protein
MKSILSIEQVSKNYSGHVALSEVSLEIPEGSVFGLLGPNGAGKTSLIRIINQITAPDTGTVLFNGEKLKPQHTERIGYLPEERGLYRKMKVGEQCVYLARLKGISKNDANSKLKYWFEKFEMSSWWNKKIEELSKGMQQKVQFIVTVLHEPQLLILDEPFSGFDPINANQIKNEILELKNKGTTIIFSTHNMGSVEELCDNIALINKSKKILDGSVKEIRKQFKTNVFTIGFHGNMLSFTNALWTGAELLEHKSEDSSTHIAKVKLLNNNKANDLLNAVMPVAEVFSFNEIIPSMNDIFIQSVQTENSHAIGTQSMFTE